ncbi:hypothetical protein HGI47_20750 [Novosphingobium sp. ERN07]|uniref:hypothetical protein n=1 Tax=Novosphingobium sp. ERN07 TaxID=2726187 RepID=UPI001456E7D5|nr:hypothetical protein [Novosphingobium sp. ERN07]NLR73304.1 hypothetical protein [Novosphingobium sp. ERN07]
MGDSARLAANTCEDAVPQAFWRQFYNIGGGETLRVVNHEFAQITARALGQKDAFASYRPHWFATRNFYGQWYADSDRLEALVPFRSETLEDWARDMVAGMPALVRLIARLFPGAGRARMEKLAKGRADRSTGWRMTTRNTSPPTSDRARPGKSCRAIGPTSNFAGLRGKSRCWITDTIRPRLKVIGRPAILRQQPGSVAARSLAIPANRMRQRNCAAHWAMTSR